ncbi:hypothetical protein [Nitrospira sp. Nam80]
MKGFSKDSLPPNPYTRQPIKNREFLAGRGRELRSIRYYLGLTASGQSPHLALIGQRGVGKTSLLNGTESIATDLKLLSIRIDLNENKVRGPGLFWHDLYATLIITLAKAGCWGGLQGPIYMELFKMMYAKAQPPSLEKVVLQIPYAYSCHTGDLSTFSCNDALVIHDFTSCIEELQQRGYMGIALLVDEADCLGTNAPLLQMLRNIFQVVQRTSLVMAGTEAIFPSISEIFSPVPRQFHRLDVKPFSQANDTAQLVTKPLKPSNRKEIAPEYSNIMELHELCGGDPSEVQLYCHHMYRLVEEGKAERMALIPQVFREVLHEYRANATAGLESVINAIEQLPDKYLFKSKWLSRQGINLEQNIEIEILRRALEKGAQLSQEEVNSLTWDLRQGYSTLFNMGITESETQIRLVGSPLTAGYWKSFVELEKDKRWKWSDDSFGELLRHVIAKAISKTIHSRGYFAVSSADEALLALTALRKGEPIPEIKDDFNDMILTGIVASFDNTTVAVDIDVQMESPAGRQIFRCRYLQSPETSTSRETVEAWINSSLGSLSSSNIVLVILNFYQWQLPTNTEFHRLARIAGADLPENVFGPSEIDIAVMKFDEGGIAESAEIFRRMYQDKQESVIANNLAFCELLLGKTDSALATLENALAKDYDPLFALNKGLALIVLGDSDTGVKELWHAIKWLGDNKNENRYKDNDPLYVLLINPSSMTVKSIANVPLIAALHANLWRMGEESKEEFQKTLETDFPEKYKSILLLLESV